ncbi:hypothetical protein DFJ74DRAFT_704018 [Hyaloraphidium curvatum]|nr:hypothetical protein DFJ74DRAFT_704018 [Hyaloraphidium curvatum]
MKIGLASPRPFRLARLRGGRLLVAAFDGRDSLARALSRPAAHYEGAPESHVRANFVGINLPWADLEGWFEAAGGGSGKGQGEAAKLGEAGGAGEVARGADAGRTVQGTGTTLEERLFRLHALWDTSAASWLPRDGWTEQPLLEPPLYVVAHIAGDTSTLRHELAHALFFLEETYRDLARGIWNALAKEHRTAVEGALAALGYDEVNYADEFQAYTLEDHTYWAAALGRTFRAALLSADPMAAASRKLLETYELYGLEREIAEVAAKKERMEKAERGY